MAPTLGFQAAGGMVEKFLPGVSFPVLMNSVLPGALAALALLPMTPLGLTKVLSGDIEVGWPKLVVAAVLVTALGGVISSLNSEFYKLYEGRIWPQRLFDAGKTLQQWRVDRLYRLQAAKRSMCEQTYNEIWYRLRVYPIDNTGMRYASHPTVLGNILYGYEDYPRDRYGMDSIFYWPRLWLVLDKDSRAEISKSWSVADGLLNLSAVSWIACLAWAVALLGSGLHIWSAERLPLHSDFRGTSLATAAWFVLGYGFYQISLPFHRNNGEIFKSLFDIHRDKLIKMTVLAPNEAETWKAAWAYLQYLRIRCPKCQTEYVSIHKHQCSNQTCDVTGDQVISALDELRRTGTLARGGEVEKPSKLI
jgi:hypothetical protein